MKLARDLPHVVREINAFAIVGVVATACHYATALGAHHFVGLAPMNATFAGYVASVGVSYLGNSLFTFRRPALHGPQFVRFAVISLAGLAMNQTIVFVATRRFGLPFYEALIPVVIIVPASTFLMSKFWAFRPAEAAAPARGPAGL
jgi:putative flippase GtrA